MNKVIVTIATVVLALMIGCAAMMNAVTPAFIEPEMIADVNEPATSFVPFTSLWDAERMLGKFDYKYQMKQLNLTRQIENNNIRHAFLRDFQLTHIEEARQFQETVFSPTGPIGILFPASVGLLIGWRGIEKPKSKKEVAAEKARNGGE